MLKQIALLLTALTLSCNDGSIAQVKFGCDPPCDKKKWLTFSYDCAYLFQDSSGAIKKSLDNDTLLHYTRHHNAPRLSKKDIESIDQALSCRTWICNKTPVKKEFYDPEKIIVFTQSTVPVAWIAMCSKSGSVACQPNSDNNEIELMNSIVYFIKNKD